MTTLADIAKKLNVATSTVSRAISAPDKVSKEMREKVMAAIEETGYKVNLQARQLRSGRSSMIATVISDLSDPLMARTASKIQEYALQKGYFPIVLSSGESSVKEAEIISKLKAYSISGLIVVPSGNTTENLRLLDKSVPVIELDRSTYTFTHDEFRMDDRAAMQMAAQYLVEQGHKDIIVLLGDSTVISSFRERLNALSFCPDKAHYRPKELDDVTALGLRRGAFEYMDELLSAGKPKSTAILACNSAIALGALMALNKHHVTVGTDMALFSLDDADWISAVPNPITSLQHPLPQVGVEAIRRLVHRIEHTYEGDPEVRLLVPRLTA